MDLSLISVPYRYDELREGLGAGPDALIAQGIAAIIERAGFCVSELVEAHLAPAAREAGRTAVNIGTLGASTAELVQQSRHAGNPALILAGDDTAAVGVISGLQLAHGADARIGVVWLDAHGDFNTPETSYSGILAGMSLAIIAGLAGPNWRAAARLSAPIPTHRLFVAGIRELDEKEEQLIRATDVQVVSTAELRDLAHFGRALDKLVDACDYVALHLDLDLLDPHLIPSSTTPSERGLEISEAAAAIRTVLGCGKVASWTICGLNPGGGNRGTRSIRSALELFDASIPAWANAPA